MGQSHPPKLQKTLFNQRNADDETVDYQVELHKYISVTLPSDMDRSVNVNREGNRNIRAGSELSVNKLRYGEKVLIETNKIWPNLESSRDLILTNTEAIDGRFRYTLIVPEKDGHFLFDPSAYSYEHGTISFKCFGRQVTTPQALAKGSKIFYEQKTAEDGYWLSGRNHFIVVGEEAETKRQLEEISFTPKIKVTVSLPQPDYGGAVEYKLDGERINGSSCSAYSGSVISMKLIPWEGWISHKTGEQIYKVNKNKTQTASIQGIELNSLFEEDEDHKPALKVTLEKSVGENTVFTLNSSGYAMEATSYGGGWKVQDVFTKNADTYNIIDNSQIIVSDRIIGTEKPIEIRIENKAVKSGKAVRMVIAKTDDEKNKTEEIRYIDDLSIPLEPIDIYKRGEKGKATAWYKSIEITIGVVDVEKFEPAAAASNTRIVLQNADTNTILVKGDLIEASQKVTVTIRPNTGYYVTGKKVGNDIYQETMKFSDYQKNVNNIITTHPAFPYYVVTLDKSDSYAKYTYKLDGKVVTGTINAKEGQKLELTYEIINPEYKLSKAAGGVVFGIGSSTSKVTETIKIDASMQGKTITKRDYNIETVKGG